MFNISFGIPLFGTPGVYFGIPKVDFGIRSFGTPSFRIPGYTQIYTVVVLHSKTYMPCRSINLRTHTFMIYEYSGKSSDINLRIKILAVDVRHITAWR